jgi:hypothetical protein
MAEKILAAEIPRGKIRGKHPQLGVRDAAKSTLRF